MSLYLYHIVQVNDFKLVEGQDNCHDEIDEVHIYSEDKVKELTDFWKDKKLYYKIHHMSCQPSLYELSIDDIEFNKIVKVNSYHGQDYTNDPLVNLLIDLLQHREIDQYLSSDVLRKLDYDTDRYKRECVKNELDQKHSRGETLSASYNSNNGGEVMSSSCDCHPKVI